MLLPTHEDVVEAAGRIADQVHRTPVLTSRSLDAMTGAELVFKAENLQRGGAFKARGAANALAVLTDVQLSGGVATHSSGNHAQAVAIAARHRGVLAHIVMPRGSAAAKRAAVESYGALVTECENTLEAREETLAQVVAETGAHVVHPYDDSDVIAGQGTVALELLEEVPDLDLIVVPVGGGGLAAGTVLAADGPTPHAKVVGAEPALADDAYRSLREGRRLPALAPTTVADGLRTALGERNFAILDAAAIPIVTVAEVEILEAMRLLWERMKVIVEPSGAVPLAAVMRDAVRFRGKRVGLVLSGGNVDLCRNELCRFWN